MLELIEPVVSIPWYNIVLILLTAVGSSALIIVSTQRSVRNIGLATAKMVASIEGAHQATQKSSDEFMVTLGRGEVLWSEGGYKMRLRRKLRTGEEDLSSNQYLSKLALSLIEAGVRSDDMTDVVVQLDDMTLSVGMDVSVRDPSTSGSLIKAALSAGFTEDGNTREEITIDDAHVEAGREAIRDAERNIQTLVDTLRMDRTTIDLIGADLETAAAPSGKVIKIARARWRTRPLAKAS